MEGETDDTISVSRNRRSSFLTVGLTQSTDSSVRYVEGNNNNPIFLNETNPELVRDCKTSYCLKYAIILILTSLISAFLAFVAGQYVAITTMNNFHPMTTYQTQPQHYADPFENSLEISNKIYYDKILEEMRNLKRNIEEKTKQMVEEALAVYDADKLGLEDFALESAGGRIVSVKGATPFERGSNYILGLIKVNKDSDPREIIRPATNPGQCFCFAGTYVKIRIRLSQEVFISAATMEHTHSNLVSPTQLTSAPKGFTIWGVKNENDEAAIFLNTFSYDIDGSARQTFILSPQKVDDTYSFVDLEILSNHGHPQYTCVYRFRVHGNVCDSCLSKNKA